MTTDAARNVIQLLQSFDITEGLLIIHATAVAPTVGLSKILT